MAKEEWTDLRNQSQLMVTAQYIPQHMDIFIVLGVSWSYYKSHYMHVTYFPKKYSECVN